MERTPGRCSANSLQRLSSSVSRITSSSVTDSGTILSITGNSFVQPPGPLVEWRSHWNPHILAHMPELAEKGKFGVPLKKQFTRMFLEGAKHVGDDTKSIEHRVRVLMAGRLR